VKPSDKNPNSGLFLAMPERQREETDQEGWMVAYADMITLLFIFFTLLLSISTINTTKFEMIKTEWNDQATSNLKTISEEFKQQIEKQNLKELVSVDLSAEGLRVSFSEQVLFGTAEAKVNADGEKVLAGVASVLKNMNQQYRVAIEGHTDSLPIKTKEFASNWTLSSARAVNVVHFLGAQGVSDRNMSIRGFADTRPMTEAGQATAAQLAKNRRVSLLIY